jgi:hypothetical protein
MGSVYLTDLADVVASAQPYVKNVIEFPGWQTRARGSGGYNGRAKGVSRHHDAGSVLSDGFPSANYETYISPSKPITNLHLSRKGDVYVCAAGATNTIGLGGPMGDFALNDGNAWQIGIEAGNTGLGEVWPEVQIRAYIELEARLWLAYHDRFGWSFPLHPDQFFDHRRWAPTRKIDRKGHAECTVDGVHYVFAQGYSSWNTDLYNQVVSKRVLEIIGTPPTPEPPPVPPVVNPPLDSDLMITVWKGTDCLAEFIGMVDKNGNALEIRWIATAQQQAARDAHIRAGARVEAQPLTGRRFQYVVLQGPIPTGDTYAWSDADFSEVRPNA